MLWALFVFFWQHSKHIWTIPQDVKGAIILRVSFDLKSQIDVASVQFSSHALLLLH